MQRARRFRTGADEVPAFVTPVATSSNCSDVERRSRLLTFRPLDSSAAQIAGTRLAASWRLSIIRPPRTGPLSLRKFLLDCCHLPRLPGMPQPLLSSGFAASPSALNRARWKQAMRAAGSGIGASGLVGMFPCVLTPRFFGPWIAALRGSSAAEARAGQPARKQEVVRLLREYDLVKAPAKQIADTVPAESQSGRSLQTRTKRRYSPAALDDGGRR
jgi:hypothetical protein